MNSGNLLDLIIRFGAVQGFITSFLLFGKRKNQSNLLLACLLLLISLACLNIYLFHVLPDQLPTVLRLIERMIPLIIVMPLGPLLYFYIRVLAGEPFALKAR